jgi:hypothetical protein
MGAEAKPPVDLPSFLARVGAGRTRSQRQSKSQPFLVSIEASMLLA